MTKNRRTKQQKIKKKIGKQIVKFLTSAKKRLEPKKTKAYVANRTAERKRLLKKRMKTLKN